MPEDGKLTEAVVRWGEAIGRWAVYVQAHHKPPLLETLRYGYEAPTIMKADAVKYRRDYSVLAIYRE